jgi:DNA-binding CsgD family transcriptional regulator
MRRIAKQFARNGDASLSPSPRRSASLQVHEKGSPFLAQCFLIWEIPTRVVRCLVPPDGEGNMPAERVAGMLAMHCLALNRRIEDFEILVLPQSSLAGNVTERAQQLIAAGRSIGSAVKLSPSERAVLDGIVRNLSNKEIACELRVSVRTVKFHVSSLLAKFDVSKRSALVKPATLGQILQSGPPNCDSGGLPGSSATAEPQEECLAGSRVDVSSRW